MITDVLNASWLVWTAVSGYTGAQVASGNGSLLLWAVDTWTSAQRVANALLFASPSAVPQVMAAIVLVLYFKAMVPGGIILLGVYAQMQVQSLTGRAYLLPPVQWATIIGAVGAPLYLSGRRRAKQAQLHNVIVTKLDALQTSVDLLRSEIKRSAR